ncbi:MAG: hypothetical protein ACOYEW_10090 [Anaerolineae bacterium]
MSRFEEGFMGTVSDELPAEMLSFVLYKVDSFIKWDVLRFLKENPHTADTPVGLALYVGRKPEVVAPRLQEMAEDGLLEVHHVGDMPVYSLTQDPETVDLVNRFLEGCKDRRFRLRVVYHVARCMR